MKKLLVILSLFVATQANAFDLNDVAEVYQKEQSKISPKDMKKATEALQKVVKKQGYDKLNPMEQKALKLSFHQLKKAKVEDPELQGIINNTVDMVNESKIFEK